mmetsp:Transcript_100552/g.224673  ORF Transcript_100552/g.224673 Transcript_100552/m.224673 type:complete len:207 (-) Transcript_100552:456-1076(-)
MRPAGCASLSLLLLLLLSLLFLILLLRPILVLASVLIFLLVLGLLFALLLFLRILHLLRRLLLCLLRRLLLRLLLWFLLAVLLPAVPTALLLLGKARQEDPEVRQRAAALYRRRGRSVAWCHTDLDGVGTPRALDLPNQTLMVLHEIVAAVQTEREGSSTGRARGAGQTRRVAGVVVQTPEELLDALVGDLVVRQCELPKGLRTVP